MSGRIGPLSGIGLENDLIVYLDAANPSSFAGNSSLPWYDLSGNSNNALFYWSVNQPVYDSTNGGSILFDGVEDYAVLPNQSSASISDNFTTQIWYKPASNNTSYIITRGKDGYGAGWGFLTAQSSISGKYSTAVTVNYPQPNGFPYTSFGVDSTTSVIPGVWKNITSVYTKDTDIKIYIDGVFEGRLPLSSSYTLRPSTVGWLIGAYPGPGTETAQEMGNGNYGEILIYKRALTEIQVLANYNRTKYRFI